MLHSGNIRLIQPYRIDPDTDSEEQDGRVNYVLIYQNGNAFYVLLSTTLKTN